MSEVVNLSRRNFLQASSLLGGGLLLGTYLPELATAVDEKNKPVALNAFVRIGTDESVSFIVGKSEMGQGPYTSLSMLLADELDADWGKVRVQTAPVDPIYNHTIYPMQLTGGSSTTRTEYERLRKVGASARAMLVAAAAESWKVDPKSCQTENGSVVHAPSGRRQSYGKLVEAAAKLTPPDEVKTKDPKDFKLIGKPIHRLDTPAKTNGSAIYGMDISVPGMLVALTARPPVFGGKAKSFDATKAKAIPGVKHVVQTEWGIAVVADGFWNAKKGRDALAVQWDDGPLANLDSNKQRDEYLAMSEKPGVVARADGDAAGTLTKAAKKLSAVYEMPYLAHASMEPLNCVADVRDDRCELWVGTQFQTLDRNAAAAALNFKPEQVTLNTPYLGGGYGRRAVLDNHFVVEAVQISKAVKAPVKLMWTREDDTRGGYYRPAALHAISGGLDAAGKPIAWQQRIVCQSFLMGTPAEKDAIKNGIDDCAVEGALELRYELPNLRLEWHAAPLGVPTLWWRSVGHSHTAFAIESFVDELAHAAGKDPFTFRRELLGKHPRNKRVLELAAEKAGWGTPLPKGHGRGIAVHESFGSFVAHVAEVSVSPEGKLRVHRFVSAVDCGPIVNPDSIKAQTEGCIVFGLTAALYDEITFEKGRVKQRNFHDYPMLRIQEMPQVEVHIVTSTESMGGVGEPGVPPVAPALTNAIFAATGKRIRKLPLRGANLLG